MGRTRGVEAGATRKRGQTIFSNDPFYNVKQALGRQGFRKIQRVTVAFVGNGGLGSNLALSLAGSGFRRFILIDGDTVSERNIPLSNAFTLKHVGKPKVYAVRSALEARFGEKLDIECYPTYSDKVPEEAITEPELLVLAVDDRWTKLAITSMRVDANKPYVHLGFLGWEASYMLVIPHKTACWACLFRPDDNKRVEKLKREGKCPEPDPNIPGAVTSGTIQRLIGFTANEIAKLFTGAENLAQYYSFDASTHNQLLRFLGSSHFQPDPDCPICRRESEIDVADLERKE
jgi:molybdopterin/thiamine biosynthesis adenylyltransferase